MTVATTAAVKVREEEVIVVATMTEAAKGCDRHRSGKFKNAVKTSTSGACQKGNTSETILEMTDVARKIERSSTAS